MTQISKIVGGYLVETTKPNTVGNTVGNTKESDKGKFDHCWLPG